MKYLLLLPILALGACNNPEKTPDSGSATEHVEAGQRHDICWKGSLDAKVPVFIHYQVDGDVIAGEITYLNTKAKTPIRLIGNIMEDKAYRLLEFDPTGNVTGVIIAKPSGDKLNGSWFSPRSEKELTLALVEQDTLVPSADIGTGDPYGAYHYQYSEEGYQGDLHLNKLAKDKASFDISSVTGAPARNIAEIDTDTITLTGNKFVYKMPGTDSCEFAVKFYKDFVYVWYTKGGCTDQFGMNATVDGFFLKVK